MPFKYPEHHPEFFTATVLEWKMLLKPSKYKQIILNSLSFLAHNNRASIYAFIIMNNHIHLVWQAKAGYSPTGIQHSLLKFTAQKIKFDLQEHHPAVLETFKVNAKDREYQFWERNALGVELFNESVLMQKVSYIHNNSVKAGLCKQPEEYFYSSARFYEIGMDDFGFLTHYKG
ncbi:MAG TPA: hypothetical protein VG738_02625 [Chitinophagaceae bacterium]|nr:hypothetical protein [Chitinophagaceae bacterium]